MTQAHKGSLVLVLMIVCGFIPPPVVAAETAPTSTKRAAFPAMTPQEREALLRASKDLSRPVSDRMRDEIKAILTDPDAPSHVRASKIGDAGSLRLRDLRPYVEAAREDRDPQVRSAAEIVLKMWDERNEEAARSARAREAVSRYQQMSPQQRREEYEARQRDMYARNRDQLLAQLQGGSVEQRRLQILRARDWARYIPEAIPILSKIVTNESDTVLRGHALRTLISAAPSNEGTISVCQSCIRADQPAGLRLTAGTHLAGQGHKEGVQALIELLQTDDVRSQVMVMGLLSSATRISFLGKTPSSFLSQPSLSEEDRKAVQKAVGDWQMWWKGKGASFVMPGLRTTQPASDRTKK